MSLIAKHRTMLPSRVSDFFNNGFQFPFLLDIEKDFFDFRDEAFLMPDANIEETQNDFRIDLAAPGLERKDFKVEVDKGLLTISAEKNEETKEETKNYKHREFSYNSFSRSFTLPENCLPDKIDAKYDNGILHLSLPKKEGVISKPKEIKVS